MKKIVVVFLVSVLFSGCATTNYVALYKTTTADITRKNDDGDIIESWAGAIIEEVVGAPMTREEALLETQVFKKNFLASTGIKFYDADGHFHYIQGGIISVDNINIDVKTKPHYTDSELISKYQRLQREYCSLPASEKEEKARITDEIIDIQHQLSVRGINYQKYAIQRVFKHKEPKEPKTKKISPKNTEKVNNLIEQAKAMDEIINTSTDTKEIRKAKNEKYEISQELYRRYGINLKKLKE